MIKGLYVLWKHESGLPQSGLKEQYRAHLEYFPLVQFQYIFYDKKNTNNLLTRTEEKVLKTGYFPTETATYLL